MVLEPNSKAILGSTAVTIICGSNNSGIVVPHGQYKRIAAVVGCGRPPPKYGYRPKPAHDRREAYSYREGVWLPLGQTRGRLVVSPQVLADTTAIIGVCKPKKTSVSCDKDRCFPSSVAIF